MRSNEKYNKTKRRKRPNKYPKNKEDAYNNVYKLSTGVPDVVDPKMRRWKKRDQLYLMCELGTMKIVFHSTLRSPCSDKSAWK